MEHIIDYIIPIIIVLFYLITSGKKKKLQEIKKQGQTPLPPRLVKEKIKALPPVQRQLPPLDRVSDPWYSLTVESHPETSSREDAQLKPLISQSLSERIDMDQAYAIGKTHRPSRGRRLLQQLPHLQDAFILHEIFKPQNGRWDEDPTTRF